MAAIMQITTYSYRFASEVLDSTGFLPLKTDVLEILRSVRKIPAPAKPKLRARDGKVWNFTTDQKALNKVLDAKFLEREWLCQPPVTNDKVTAIKADYKKGRVQVEAQFGNMARWYTDVFKFQVSYSLGLIDVGILVVPMQSFSATIDENVVYYERVTRELPYAKMSITLPIWVLGVQP